MTYTVICANCKSLTLPCKCLHTMPETIASELFDDACRSAFERENSWKGKSPMREADGGYFPIEVHVAYLQFKRGWVAALKFYEERGELNRG